MFEDDEIPQSNENEPKSAGVPGSAAPVEPNRTSGAQNRESSARGPHPRRSSRRPKTVLAVVLITVIGGLAAGGYFYRDALRATRLGRLMGPEESPQEMDVYYCPMHPDYKSDKPGNCPICSMKLVKLERPHGSGGAESGGPPQTMPGMPGMEAPSGTGAEAPSADGIYIAPQRQQLIGLRSVPAMLKPLSKEIRAVGKVTYDETKLTHIHTKVSGYIEQVFVDYVGKVVKKGDPLFTIYSPELVATQEEYLLALRGQEVLGKSPFDNVSLGSKSLLEATRRRLLLWDITAGEIETLEKEGKARRALTIYSPVAGIVTERAAYHHGRFVNPEMDLYMIVDLSSVWVVGEVYEYELPFVKEGQTAIIEFPYASTIKSLRGRVAYLYPFLDPKTRTARIRFEFSNPGFVLKPDMFMNVKLSVNLGKKLVVPEDAVLNTGTEQYVFIDQGEGYFAPRAVKLGAEAGGYYAIESGLREGERVVTAANFILDSESRLKGAFSDMGKLEDAKKPETPAVARPSVNIEILEPKTAKVGRNPIRLRVKDASGGPITDAEVEVTLFMPPMGSMAPMTAKTTLKHEANGEYAGEIEVPMAYSWQTTVRVTRRGQTIGSIRTTINAR
ncbi:MAG: efflux RND transporter periplasmic adaptor subunit [Acidobacteria bacterium]|nr:efflux RND transporter periplasmic adaptor subunit [Acidobacteriota bacterium]